MFNQNILKTVSLNVIFIVFLVSAVDHSRKKLEQVRQTSISNEITDKPLYLPNVEAVKSITLGYEHFASILFWFSTLDYFGEKFHAKASMPWFKHRCELVTDLDPRAKHVFEFCGTLLSWIAKEPEKAKQILDKAVVSDPSYWRYYYLRGFNSWYFLENFGDAKSDFETASTLPNAPAFLVTLASRLMVKEGGEDTAIAFLKASYVRTSDENAKKAIAEKINLAVVAKDLKGIKEAIAIFNKEQSRFPEALTELVEKKYLKEVPIDPYAQNYLYDKTTGNVKSEIGGEGLTFKGKTASSKNESQSPPTVQK